MLSLNNVKNTSLLIESQYWGPISYFKVLKSAKKVHIEKWEHFVKATYRNRCHIATPDGMLTMTVPIEHGRNTRRVMKDITLFNEIPWQKTHWDTLCSAYRRSPYFEYFEDDLHPFYHKEYKYLVDFNEAIFNWVLEQLDWSIDWTYTESFEKKVEQGLDLRSKIHPKSNKNKIDLVNDLPKYHQVFEDRTGFLVNLSIADLLFAEGPKAGLLLEEEA